MFKPPFAWVIIAFLLTTTDITQAHHENSAHRLSALRHSR